MKVGGGVSRLTGSPKVLELPPPSVYRCPAETEGTTELHTPPSTAALCTAAAQRGLGLCICSPDYGHNAQAACVYVTPAPPRSREEDVK